MKLLIFLFMGALALTSASYAGEKGHGGDGIYIDNKLFLLDLVEAGIEEDAKIGTDVDSGILRQVEGSLDATRYPVRLISAKFTELANVNPKLAFHLLETLKGVTWHLVNSSLINVSDENSALDKEFVQLAIRRDRRVMIDRSLWAKLDGVNKTALIFHELFYFIQPVEFIKLPGNVPGKFIQRSTEARIETGRIFTKILTQPETPDLLFRLNDFRGVPVLLSLRKDELVLSEYECLGKGDCISGAVYSLKGPEYSRSLSINWSFYKDGHDIFLQSSSMAEKLVFLKYVNTDSVFYHASLEKVSSVASHLQEAKFFYRNKKEFDLRIRKDVASTLEKFKESFSETVKF